MNAPLRLVAPIDPASDVAKHDATLTSIKNDLVSLTGRIGDLTSYHVTDHEEALGAAIHQLDHVRQRLLSALDTAAELAGAQ